MKRSGFTLLELVIVLAILAALSALVLTSTIGLTDVARFEGTQRSMQNLRSAILGREPATGEDPTAVPPGFLADIGRLPRAVETGAVDPKGNRVYAPLELLEPFGLPRFDLQRPAGDTDLWVQGGWRGPYVRLPIGATEFDDGWGREFELLDGAGLEVDSETDPVAAIVSLGADGVVGGVGLDLDLDRDLVFVDTTLGIDRTRGAVTVELEHDLTGGPGTDLLLIRVYGVEDGLARTIMQEPADTAALDALIDAGESWPKIAVIRDLPIGAKWIRAYGWNSNQSIPDPEEPLGALNVDPLATDLPDLRSAPQSFTVIEGGVILSQKLELEASSE